ncbi:hypothetical protein Tco_1312928 [Tanacetum coccineum]
MLASSHYQNVSKQTTRVSGEVWEQNRVLAGFGIGGKRFIQVGTSWAGQRVVGRGIEGLGSFSPSSCKIFMRMTLDFDLHLELA